MINALGIDNPGWLANATPAAVGCVDLAGVVAISAPSSQASGTVTATADLSGLTAGSAPYIYVWTVLTDPTTTAVTILSGQGTSQITYTQTSVRFQTGTSVRLVVSNCGATTRNAFKTVNR